MTMTQISSSPRQPGTVSTASAVDRTCPTCQQLFESVELLRQHQIYKWHRLACPSCLKTFVTADAVSQHQRAAHGSTSTARGSSSFPSQPYGGTVAKRLTSASSAQPSEPSCADAKNQQHLRLAYLTSLGEGALLPIEKPVQSPSVAVEPVTLRKSDSITTTTTITTTSPSSSSRTTTTATTTITLPVLTKQDLLLARLLPRCHSTTCLSTQGYNFLTVEPPWAQPWNGAVPRSLFQHIPTHSTSTPPRARKAVVIDCEMVMTEDPYGRDRSYNGLAYLAAVDFLTGEVLIDRYVRPSGRVTRWMTRITGITPESMNAAILHGQAFESWQAARQGLWEHIDRDTVLIGHALHNDLNALGIIHPRVVDTAIVTAEAVFSTRWGEARRFPRLWGLKTLAMAMLGRQIQASSQGHSAVEDALATRDVLLWGQENTVLLGEWARRERRLRDDVLGVGLSDSDSESDSAFWSDFDGDSLSSRSDYISISDPCGI
ncbi:hypothetical protein ASPACDRAFT_1885118 [Aspergillus aculeatus ATCC 16872]|uniref:C2H2-type domain-containing protein n=1 Tax=Aspergillus aculeatus (strain ATCC 16872 / CBS 172.66 / WB 5094) TaxID=690307 RepID=A0A1L9X544_ASPA1|nr:uncharacterized protein ASPACDRAFT_1885118 [Aspergillus aculeatus ATCC 16872]OJK03586.1 hypothetical protein ASPACDRAFT_1885118 [Aspergillus aculeatus ATCC 16872]